MEAQEDLKSQSLEEREREQEEAKEDKEVKEEKEAKEEKDEREEKEEKDEKEEKEEGRDGITIPRFNDNALQFLDSMDGYLTLLDSLSWTLRQGWLQLASARHSMGASRISSAVLDLKSHSASTFVQVTQQSNPGAGVELTHRFILHKWGSSENDNGASPKAVSPQIRQRKDKDGVPPPVTAEAEADRQRQVHKERFKSLAVFGALVSPKLRAAQLSFETALDALVEIANVRALMFSTFDQVREELEYAKANQ